MEGDDVGGPARSSEAILTGAWTQQPAADGERDDVAAAARGDHEAFERLYRLNAARIFGLARRMAGSDAADELTQDVFIRAWEKLGSFRGDSRFATWLYRLAVNVLIENRRSFARRSLVERDDERAYDRASVAAADAGFSLDLESALDLVPQGARHVFVLHDIEGYKHEEIGKLLGITAGTSKGQLHRARMILRRRLGGTVVAAAPDGSQS